MIRIREITLPPEHNPAQLGYEAARLLNGLVKVAFAQRRGSGWS